MRRNHHSGRFIVLEGADGVGKTTVARQLERTATDATIRFVSRRFVPRSPPLVHEAMRRLSDVLWAIGEGRELSADFWISIQAAWFDAHSEHVVEPLLASGLDVLVDGWVYKFFAKLELQGYLRPDLEKVFTCALIPDVVVLLRSPAEHLIQRKIYHSTERGLHAGYGELNDLSFVHYQGRISSRLTAFGECLGWKVIDARPDDSPRALCARITEALRVPQAE